MPDLQAIYAEIYHGLFTAALPALSLLATVFVMLVLVGVARLARRR